MITLVHAVQGSGELQWPISFINSIAQRHFIQGTATVAAFIYVALALWLIWVANTAIHPTRPPPSTKAPLEGVRKTQGMASYLLIVRPLDQWSQFPVIESVQLDGRSIINFDYGSHNICYPSAGGVSLYPVLSGWEFFPPRSLWLCEWETTRSDYCKYEDRQSNGVMKVISSHRAERHNRTRKGKCDSTTVSGWCDSILE